MRFLLSLALLGKEGDSKTKLQNILFCELEIPRCRAVVCLTVVHYYKLAWTGVGACVPPFMFSVARLHEDCL